MQTYNAIAATDFLSDSRQNIADRDDSIKSSFSGTVFPTTSLLVGMKCYRTDLKKLYVLTSTGPDVWIELADFNAATGLAPQATRLATTRAISLTGDVTGTANFDGTAAASIAATLANSGATAGAYAYPSSVTVDAKGRVTTIAASGFTPANATRNLTAGTGLLGGGNLTADRSFSVDLATAAQWRAATANKPLEPSAIWASMEEVALADAATITWDMSAGFDFVVTLGGNRTLAAPTNPKVGQKGRLVVIQDGTGTRTLAWDAVYKFTGGIDGVLSSAAGVVDIFYYDVRSASFIVVCSAGRAFA